MWGLFVSTVLTSAVDSLNPIAITQQFVLQGLVKKPKHIWFFIVPTGVINLLSGYLAYYGLLGLIGSFFGRLMEQYRQILLSAELILGILFLIAVGYLVQRNRILRLEKQMQSLMICDDNSNGNEETEAASKIKSVSPMALMVLGAGATISELMTALPYFALLAILFNYQLTFFQVSFILIVYNFIYTLPLMVLYVIYIKAQDKFDSFYRIIKARVVKWSGVLAPLLMGLIGVFLVYHSMSLL